MRNKDTGVKELRVNKFREIILVTYYGYHTNKNVTQNEIYL